MLKRDGLHQLSAYLEGFESAFQVLLELETEMEPFYISLLTFHSLDISFWEVSRVEPLVSDHTDHNLLESIRHQIYPHQSTYRF